MKSGIFKRIFTASVAAALVFSMSGCVSNSTTDNAKSIRNSNDNYNVADYEEEEVVVEPMMKISFSEKGTVRYEGAGTNLIDFWEYGSNKSDTVYFEGPGDDFLESYYKRDSIEFAFEYKDMIYFLKRTYDDSNSKPKYDYTLYRMNLKGENITKLSTISLDKIDGIYDYDDYYDDYYDTDGIFSGAVTMDPSVEYEFGDIYVENNSLVFGVYYYGSSSNIKNNLYRIDLTSGISNELMDITDDSLSFVRLDNEYTYIYVTDYSYEEDYDEEDYEESDDTVYYDKLKVYRIDNKTNEKSEVKLTDKTDKIYSEVLGVYDDKLICSTSDYVDLIDKEGNVTPILNKKQNANIDFYEAQLVGDYILTSSVNTAEKVYKCNLQTGEIESLSSSSDLSKTMFNFGDKYICYKEPTAKEREKYEEQYFESMDSIFSSVEPLDLSKYIFWSKEEDVLADKHNYMPIKNFPRSGIDYFY